MNAADVNTLVAKALEHGYGLWVDTDYGDVDLFGAELREAWDNTLPGEGFEVLGVITDDVRKEL